MMTTFSSMNERSHANTEAKINCMPAMEGARDGPFICYGRRRPTRWRFPIPALHF